DTRARPAPTRCGPGGTHPSTCDRRSCSRCSATPPPGCSRAGAPTPTSGESRPSAAPEQLHGAPVTATIALVYGNRLRVGGVETHLLSLLRHGDRTRYRWVLVSATSSEFAARARALGAPVVPWEPAHNLDLPALTYLRRLLRAQRVDLVHMHSP